MACATCNSGIIYDDPSILGRNITGRSVPGQDVMYQNGVMMPVQNQTMPTQPKKLAVDWAAFVAGAVVGGIIVAILATATGRSLVGAAGQRAARYVSRK